MKEYIAKKINGEMTIDDARWESADIAELDYVWEDAFPSPFKTTARLVHSDNGYTLLMRSNEWPLVAKCTVLNGAVCCDSCMEFFFTPNNTDKNYLNFEVNPAGMLHLGLGDGVKSPREHLDTKGEVVVTTRVIAGVEWCVMLQIPYSYLKKYFTDFTKEMKGNFYKCGDETPTKHYSTWNPVKTEKPNYHKPEFFGRIILSDELL